MPAWSRVLDKASTELEFVGKVDDVGLVACYRIKQVKGFFRQGMPGRTREQPKCALKM